MKPIQKKIHPELKKFIPIVKIIGKMFGRNCETVLHDFSNPSHSIIAIENGHVTGRKIGGPITDFALSSWRKGGYGEKKEDTIINYKTKTKDGEILKSSSFFIKDEKKNFIGCVCINYNLTGCLMFYKIMEEFSTFVDLNKKKLNGETEKFSNDVNELLSNIIGKAIDEVGKPVSMMQKSDKMRVAKTVEEKGGFLIKGAVNQLAFDINVSRYTIYNYLDELKIKKKE